MPPAVTRELSITYGGYVVGGTQTNRLLTGKYRQSRTYERSSITFEVLVIGSTEAAFKSECEGFEAAFRTPRGALTVTLGAVNLIAVTHTGNTGYNAAPSVAKVGGDEDNARSRKYEVSIEFSEPADLSGQNGRRSSTVDQSYDASRKRTVTISGAYTALGGNSARDQYESASPAFFTAVLSGLGGNFEKTFERADNDDADKELTFSVTYEEVIYNQASGVLDHPAIVQPQITIARSLSSPGDAPAGAASRLATITANFTSSVDWTVTTDLQGLYEDTIKPYLVAQAQAVAGSASVALVNEDYNLNGTANQIAATLTFLAAPSLLNIEYSVTTEVTDDFGKVFIPTWTGGKYDAYVLPGPGMRRRIVTERLVQFGDLAYIEAQGQGTVDIREIGALVLLAYPPDGGTTGWVTDLGSFKQEPRRHGHGYQFDTTEVNSRFEQRWVVAPLTPVATEAGTG